MVCPTGIEPTAFRVGGIIWAFCGLSQKPKNHDLKPFLHNGLVIVSCILWRTKAALAHKWRTKKSMKMGADFCLFRSLFLCYVLIFQCICNRCFNASCNTAEKFTPLCSASALSQEGMERVFFTNFVCCLSLKGGIKASIRIMAWFFSAVI